MRHVPGRCSPPPALYVTEHTVSWHAKARDLRALMTISEREKWGRVCEPHILKWHRGSRGVFTTSSSSSIRREKRQRIGNFLGLFGDKKWDEAAITCYVRSSANQLTGLLWYSASVKAYGMLVMVVSTRDTARDRWLCCWWCLIVSKQLAMQLMWWWWAGGNHTVDVCFCIVILV